ncbi:MAG: ShlB/FhaC/HecB family hemolysin secretion/activation protein [Pseudomonadota bacterium]
MELRPKSGNLNRGGLATIHMLAAMQVVCAVSLVFHPSIVAADGAMEVPARPSERSLPSPVLPPVKPPVDFVLPRAREIAPDSLSDGADLEIRAVAFEGNHHIETGDLLAIAQPFIGRRLKAAEIEELRHRITRHYIGKGYVSSGAVLQEDAYHDGMLTFQIIEGRLENIRLSGEERLHASYIRDRLSLNDDALNINVLQERFRLLLTDPLISKMNARILPGSMPGTAILDVDITRARPYQLTFFTHNHHEPSSGSDAYGVSGWVRNLTGFGDMLDVTYQEGRGNARSGLGWSVPVTRYGTLVELRYEEGDSSLIEEVFRSLDINSTFKSRELSVRQPVINMLLQQLNIGLTWSKRESSTTLLGTPFSFSQDAPDGHSQVDVWRLSQDYWQRAEESVLVARSTFSEGRNNSAQDSGIPSVPERHYFVWLGQFQYARQVMDNDASVVARGFIQQTSNRLVSLERMAIGGVSTVRGYRENEILRDKGYAASLELHYPLSGRKAANRFLEAVVFYDDGAARNQNEAPVHLNSAGVGITGQYKHLSGELYIATPLKKLPSKGNGDLQDHGIHFQIRYDIF